MFLVSKHKQSNEYNGYTEKYLQDSFLTMHFVHTTRLGNRTYQICCISPPQSDVGVMVLMLINIHLIIDNGLSEGFPGYFRSVYENKCI